MNILRPSGKVAISKTWLTDPRGILARILIFDLSKVVVWWLEVFKGRSGDMLYKNELIHLLSIH
jgi:hypothetical protein